MSDARISITNYDVLLEPTDTADGSYTKRQLAKNSDHVGNNRLQVFLNLYQQAYDTARQSGNKSECDGIVSKIVNTVCQQCVPPGRFLVDVSSNAAAAASSSSRTTSSTPVWSVLDENEAMKLIHAILQPTSAPPAAAAPRKSVAMSSTSEATKMSANITNTANASNNNNTDDGQKRRRRSSLLRRSASESMVGMASLSSMGGSSGGSSLMSLVGGKKKVLRESMEEPTWSSSWSANKNGIITTLNRMDVILTSSRDALDPNSQSVGNNRLHILVAMQSGKYQQATIDGREAILDEVIQTVNTFWKGRFLTESDLGYEELDKDVARNALRSIFDMRSGQNLLTSRQRVEPPIMPDRSLSPGMTGGYPTSSPLDCSTGASSGMPGPLKTGLIKQASTSMIPSGGSSGGGAPLISNDTKMGLARQVSTSMIPTEHIPVSLPEVGQLRSAAVKSLQKQRQRQNIASRLEMGARRFIKPPNQIVTNNMNMNMNMNSSGGNNDFLNSNNNMNNMQNPMMFRGSINSSMNSHTSSNGSADLLPVVESRIPNNAGLMPSSKSGGSNVQNNLGYGFGVGGGMNNGGYSSSSSSMASAAKKRQSTVLTTLDPGVMEQLVADFDDADCNDGDDNEPLPC
eukprot:CAMPEP_0113453206 /NCGR_PEP_ID=MMETSP0014_2-20120614/7240_1 /TAXON_ID=2857 /ORGANISM="Nitzschia sp." /LENGTH=628 /DNA_ID=CAMNT_0000344597 /DNA_START=222 /DNA_END=2108 /DNA_ORIENTATION=- /assembly_acc=CAM_ASM_000159